MRLLITGGINLGGTSYQAGDVIEVDDAKAKEFLQFPKVSVAPEVKAEAQSGPEVTQEKPKKKAK